MSTPIEGAETWRASIERQYAIRAPNPAGPAGGGGAVSPWQALMAQAAIARGEPVGANPRASDSGWRPRIEPAPMPTKENPPAVKDSPERVETAAARPGQADPKPGLFETGEFSVADVIDTINPLQHIPIISTIYRELTGDRIGHGARMAGDVLFLGPLGGLTAMANILVQESSGLDIGEHALAMFKPASEGEQIQVASEGGQDKTASNDEQALAELLPPGAMPISGRSVDFAALPRPAAFAGPNAPPATASGFSASAAVVDDLPPPPPPATPLAGPGWKGFYTTPDEPAAAPPTDARPKAQRALAPDPMAALVAKRTPGSMAAASARMNRPPNEAPSQTDAMSGAIAAEGGWFSDVMIEALGKYQDAQRLRPAAPAAGTAERAPGGTVNIVN